MRDGVSDISPHVRHEIKPLTGIRGVAAFLVMLYHVPLNPHFASDAMPFLHAGYLCVDLFYVLSGFVLAYRYRAWFAEGITARNSAAFIVLRLGRVYPAYIVAFGLYYARWLLDLNGQRTLDFNAYDVATNLALLQGWGIGAKTICGPTWSVSAELFAYLFFPLLVFQGIARGTVGSILLAAAAVAGLIYVALSPDGVNGALDVINENNMLPLLRCVSEFSLGLVAFAFASGGIGRKIFATRWATPVILALLFLLLWCGAADVVVVLTFPLLVASLFYDQPVGRALFGNRLIHWMGVISYSFYLLHLLARDVAAHVMTVLDARFGELPHLPFILLAIAASAAAAFVFQRCIEVPGRKLLEKTAQRFFPSLPLRQWR